MIEIHGMKECPFAWRVRVTAREKGIPFEWIPYDVPDPDPRAKVKNADRKSPKLVEDGFQLIESLVITSYLDEAYPERPLQSLGARERAQMRLREKLLAKLEVHVQPPVDERIRKRVQEGYETLDQLLGRSPWLGGTKPDLSDIAVWPFLWMLQQAGLEIPKDLRRAHDYWKRAMERDSLVATRP